MTVPPPSLSKVRQRISEAVQKSRREENDVTLIGVTKSHPLETIIPFVEAGLGDIGENYVQEAEKKYLGQSLAIRKHMIGPLQSNKCFRAVQLFDVIQTVENSRILQKIAEAARRLGIVSHVLIQVNFRGDEQTQHGCTREQFWELANKCVRDEISSTVSWEGMMTVAPFSVKGRDALCFYQEAYDFFLEAKRKYPNCLNLSMGMSDTLEEAIEAGATMVRIGTALFGSRS